VGGAAAALHEVRACIREPECYRARIEVRQCALVRDPGGFGGRVIEF
jgi:hypothetical protein